MIILLINSACAHCANSAHIVKNAQIVPDHSAHTTHSAHFAHSAHIVNSAPMVPAHSDHTTQSAHSTPMFLEAVVIGSFPTITVDILEKTLVHLLLQLPLSAVVNNMSRELELF